MGAMAGTVITTEVSSVGDWDAAAIWHEILSTLPVLRDAKKIMELGRAEKFDVS